MLREYRGLLFIGDPHLSSRNPSGRKDNYSEAILCKVGWCLQYAQREQLLPCFLGDVFDRNWERQISLIGSVCELLVGHEVLTIYGNHDITRDGLTDGQALSLLVRAGLVNLVSEKNVWTGVISGRKVMVGGTSFGRQFPLSFPPGFPSEVLVFWMTHSGLEERQYFSPDEMREIAGIDVIINGHIHIRQRDERRGKTLWITPGNIARNQRVERPNPAVLRIDIDTQGWRQSYVAVPCASAEDTFHDRNTVAEIAEDTPEGIAFVRALSDDGVPMRASLEAHLEANRDKFEPEIYDAIVELSKEVLAHAGQNDR